MSPAEKFGFLGPFAWLANQEWWVIMLVCLVITPGMMLLLAPILESRWLPLGPSYQFRAFFPGDVFLSLAVTLLIWSGRELPAEKGWYSSSWFHALVFLATLGLAVGLTLMEIRAPVDAAYAWPERTRTSPTKLYHNFALYWLYGYMAIVAAAACLAGGLWLRLVEALLIASPWLFGLLTDNRAAEEVRLARLQYAHIADWRPIWANSWRVRGVDDLP